MSDQKKKKRRPLHFALSGALLVPGLMGAACGPDEEDVTMNVPMPEPTGNPMGDDPPPPPEETANPVGEESPEVADPPVNPAAMEPPPAPEPTTPPGGERRPQPTANPSGDESPDALEGIEALGDPE